MGPFDAPKEPPKPADVRPAESTGDVNKFLEEWIHPRAAQNAGAKVTDGLSIGQIDAIKIPTGWREGPSSKPTGGSSIFREFHPTLQPEVQLNFYYRGRRTSEEAGYAFTNILEKPAHVLTQQELQTLRDTIREKNDPQAFSLLQAKTDDINGKRVLVVEGRYKHTEQDNRTIYVDSDGTGTAVQEISYQAPRSEYSRHLPIANTAIKSIKWR